MSDYWCLDLIKDDDDGDEERKYTFYEWYRLCEGIRVEFRSCYQSCTSLLTLGKEVVNFGDLMRCHEECLEDVAEYGKKYGLTETEVKMCIYL